VTTKLRTNFDIARRVREMADKRERAAARASRRSRQQLNAMATSYRALADALERGPGSVAEKQTDDLPVEE
jgi:hypothetical protein